MQIRLPLAILNPMLFEEVQDGRHSGRIWYRNKTILAILNFLVALMPPAKLGLNPI